MGTTSDWSAGSNWSPASQPTNTATFSGTAPNTSVNLTASTTNINSIDFSAATSTYTISVGSGRTLNMGGSGIVGASTQNISISDGNVNFRNSSSAGLSNISTYSDICCLTPIPGVTFYDTSTAGHATISLNAVFFGSSQAFITFRNYSTAGLADINLLNGTAFFYDSSSAGAANITGGALSEVQFSDSSSAGSATINTPFGAIFSGNSTAGTSTIFGINETYFKNSSTAGSASITNSGQLFFLDSSTAGSAKIVNNNELGFAGQGDGGQSQIINGPSGVIGLYGANGPANNGTINIGSIAGSGKIFLGSSRLSVGGNNLSTTFDGVVSDNDQSITHYTGPGGGSLLKVGTGTLVLTAANTYTGPTEVQNGTLEIDGSLAASSNVQIDSGGALNGSGIVGGNVLNNGLVTSTGMRIGGSYVQGSAGNLIIGVTPTGPQFLNVSGTASLNGTVTFAYAPGSYSGFSKSFLHAASLGGTSFSTVAASAGNPVPSGFAQSVSYTATDATLILTQTQPVAPATPVKIAPSDTRLFSNQSVAFAQGNLRAVTGLLDLSFSDSVSDALYGHAAEARSAARTWVRVDGTRLSGAAIAAAPSYRVDSGGLEGGADAPLGAATDIGFALGYERSDLSDSVDGSAEGTTFRAGVYGGHRTGPIDLSGVVSFAKAWNRTTRPTGAGAALSSYTSEEWTGAIQASAPFEYQNWALTPAAGVALSVLRTAPIAESNKLSSTFALTGTAAAQTQVSPYVTIAFSRSLSGTSGVTYSPSFTVGLRGNGASDGQAFRLVAADGTTFDGNRASQNRTEGLLNLRLSARRGQWAAYAMYRGSAGSAWSEQGGELGLRVQF